eukprot:COSAG05_NODE_4746_length_1388_cov_0.992242_1_plen_367_part_00
MSGATTLAAVMSLVAPASAATLPGMPACDMTKPSQEFCADYCNYKCAFYDPTKETGRPQNITVYRITPANTTGIRNKNTGDAIGDVDFYLSRKNLTQQCAKDPNSFGCFLDGDNIYGQFTVEIDGLWGPYEECNPVSVGGHGDNHGGMDTSGWSDTQNFTCGENCIHPTRAEGCAQNSRNRNGSSQMGAGVACFCDTTQRNKKSVGRGPRGGKSHHSYGPVGLPPQCSIGFYAPGRHHWGPPPPPGPAHCLTGTAHSTVQGWSFDSVASMACDACSQLGKECTGWAMSTDNRSATLFTGTTRTEPFKECVSFQHEVSRYGSGGSWFGVSAGTGYWYNTPLQSECAPGTPLGTDGCTWRMVEAVKCE